jgi:transposase InsO family protein
MQKAIPLVLAAAILLGVTATANAQSVMKQFLGLDHARTKITNWVNDYNQRRPHSALGYLTPVAYAASLSATSPRLPS